MIETMLLKSKYLTMAIVIIASFCAFVLYLMTSISAIIAIYETTISGIYTIASTKSLAVKFLKIIDLYLICIGLQIIALGTYKLFVNKNIRLPAAMDTTSFSELKLSLVKISSIVLLILFVENAVELGPSRELLEYGIAISAILIATSWGKKIFTHQGKD